ncbi:autophagy-related protein 16-1 [Elysia marginata]|uniref:Autophagy-related protein 16-1 n=1 Tax=Elysia marginata TaxID=1093978 RepID=A0AAV4F264_9GAST|nr:autophagy-related protein 16-1 [Elysia marginata]
MNFSLYKQADAASCFHNVELNVCGENSCCDYFEDQALMRIFSSSLLLIAGVAVSMLFKYNASSANTHALEQKLFRLQEELTEMHKKRGENSQQIIDLTATVQEKDKEIHHKEAMISDMLSTNLALKQANRNLELSLAELGATNQMLKDEHQALQMAFSALEEKYRKCQEDNQDLVARWMDQKAKDADRMNEENADFIKDRQRKLARDLEEAAKEQHVTENSGKSQLDGFMPPICVKASVPTRAQHVFDAHDGEVYSVQWNSSGRFFATGGADRKIKLWDYHNSLHKPSPVQQAFVHLLPSIHASLFTPLPQAFPTQNVQRKMRIPAE